MSFKKTAIALAAAAALTASASSYAAYAMPTAEPAPVESGNWYISGFGGVAFTPDNNAAIVAPNALTYDTAGFDAGIAAGYRSGPFRYEMQYMFMRTGHDKLAGAANTGDTDVHAGMANIYYVFQNLSDIVSPYIGGGIGIGYLRTTSLGTSKSNQTEFAYQAALGMLFNVDNNFDVDVGYRYFGTSTPNSIFTDRYQNHLINLGVVYHIV